MNYTFLFGQKITRSIFRFRRISRLICGPSSIDNIGRRKKLHETNDETPNFNWERLLQDETNLGSPSMEMHTDDKKDPLEDFNFSPHRKLFKKLRLDADKICDILRQDGPGVDARSALDKMHLLITNPLVVEVLTRILRSINHLNKSRSARVGYKFFVWSGCQSNYRHTFITYNLIMKIFADSDEYKAMWRLLDEMIENRFPTTARTFNILICTCGEAGVARRLVERFIKSKTFNYRPFKNSFNAILHSLLAINQYKLIEWLYEKMLLDGHLPDILTYNVIMCAKIRLGKLDQFHGLLYEMVSNGCTPDLHTYNLILHVHGKVDNPRAALNLLNYMEETGFHPSVLHFTTLIDGLSWSGNLEACKYFFDAMIKKGCKPDVVCYTVMITGYVVAGELERAQEMFDDMIVNGQLPNVFTYNSMIRGLCIAGKFEEACSMLNDMECKGCNPNFLVYSNLVGKLRNDGKVSKAHEIIRQMVEKGHHFHLISKIKGYRRC